MHCRMHCQPFVLCIWWCKKSRCIAKSYRSVGAEFLMHMLRGQICFGALMLWNKFCTENKSDTSGDHNLLCAVLHQRSLREMEQWMQHLSGFVFALVYCVFALVYLYWCICTCVFVQFAKLSVQFCIRRGEGKKWTMNVTPATALPPPPPLNNATIQNNPTACK